MAQGHLWRLVERNSKRKSHQHPPSEATWRSEADARLESPFAHRIARGEFTLAKRAPQLSSARALRSLAPARCVCQIQQRLRLVVRRIHRPALIAQGEPLVQRLVD